MSCLSESNGSLPSIRLNAAAAGKVAILPAIAARRRRRQSNHDPLSGRRRRHPTPHLRARIAHRRAGGRAAPEPAGVDPGQLPGARVRAPSVGAERAEQGGVAVPVEQLDKATWLVRASTPGQPLVVRYQVYAFDTSVRAAFLDSTRGFFNGTGLCLRVEGQEATPHALALDRPARRLGGRDDARAAPGRRQRPRVHRRRLRRAGRPSGRARPLLARPLRRRRRAARVRRRRRAARFRRRAPARRQPAPVRGRDQVLARCRRGAVRALSVHAQRPRGRPRRARAPLEHGAGRAAARPAAPCRRRCREAARQGRDQRRLRRRPRPDRARVLPRLERQAAEAARVRDARLHARELHRAALVLRRLHLVLRRPDRAAQRPDRRAALPEAAGDDDLGACRRRPGAACRASPRRASMPGSSTTAPTRTRPTRRSATTPRARWSRSRST